MNATSTNNTIRTSCVLRKVSGIDQYMRLCEIPVSLRVKGEKVFTGTFRSAVVTDKSSPSGSNKVTIYDPVGELSLARYAQVAA